MDGQPSDSSSRNIRKKPRKRNKCDAATGELHKKSQLEILSEKINEHSELLSELKDVPKTLENVNKLLEAVLPIQKESLDTQTDDGDDLSIAIHEGNSDDTISALLAKSANETTHEEFSNPNELMDILNMTQAEPEYGPEFHTDIAESLNRLASQKSSQEAMDRWKESFKPPSNCKSLGVPRVNTEIWPLLSQKTRQIDYAHQQVQQQISMASVALGRISEKIYSAGKQTSEQGSRELLKLSMEASSILAIVNQNIIQKRKLDIKPSLNRELASICTNRVPATEWLFGDNITEQLKASKSTASVVRSNVVKPQFQNNRFSPYSISRPQNSRPLNWKRTSSHVRGGAHARRPRGFSYNRRFQPPTQ